jgi:hypothetical protein
MCCGRSWGSHRQLLEPRMGRHRPRGWTTTRRLRQVNPAHARILLELQSYGRLPCCHACPRACADCRCTGDDDSWRCVTVEEGRNAHTTRTTALRGNLVSGQCIPLRRGSCWSAIRAGPDGSPVPGQCIPLRRGSCRGRAHLVSGQCIPLRRGSCRSAICARPWRSGCGDTGGSDGSPVPDQCIPLRRGSCRGRGCATSADRRPCRCSG